MVAGGDLSAFEVYRLKHQQPLNRLTHVIGIPTIVVSIAFPLFAWGVLAWKEWLILSAVGWAFNFWGGYRVELQALDECSDEASSNLCGQ